MQENLSPVAMIIISIALMLFGGFLMTRVTKLLKLPNVTAYIITGILLGPFCFKLIPKTVIDGMDFISDIALAFIAFNTGEFFKLSDLKKNGMKVVTVETSTVLQSSSGAKPGGFFSRVWIVLLYSSPQSGVFDSARRARGGYRTGVHRNDHSPDRRKRRFRKHSFAGGCT